MKPTAYIVNTARGAIIDQAALVDVLRAGAIAGAALDVFESEPLPSDHPLRSLPNTVLTPHLGWPTDEMYAQFATAAADAIIDFMNGRGSSAVSARSLTSGSVPGGKSVGTLPVLHRREETSLG